MRTDLIISSLFIFFSSFLQDPENRSPVPEITIDIQSFSDLPPEHATHVLSELKKVYPKVELKKAIELPRSAYYTPRKRYRADSLISYLSRRTPCRPHYHWDNLEGYQHYKRSV
ncbi:MAG: hypothetical protein ACJ76F_06705 [Bacteroidia bacterium]